MDFLKFVEFIGMVGGLCWILETIIQIVIGIIKGIKNAKVKDDDEEISSNRLPIGFWTEKEVELIRNQMKAKGKA